jgi:hypothetical protein
MNQPPVLGYCFVVSENAWSLQTATSVIAAGNLTSLSIRTCMCVCVSERDRERERRVCVCACACLCVCVCVCVCGCALCLLTNTARLPPDDWHTLQLRFSGTSITPSLDGQTLGLSFSSLLPLHVLVFCNFLYLFATFSLFAGR